MYIDEKYRCDISILSIIFNYYKKDGDLLEPPNDLLEYPKLILLCRSDNFKKPEGFIGYNYFKLIFISPSTYSFNIKPNAGTAFDHVPLGNYNNVGYSFSVPFTYEMEETQINDHHYQWKIFFNNKTKETEFIRICADELKIEDLDLEGHPDLDKFII